MIKKGLENQRKNLQQLELKNEKILKEISKIKRLKKAKGITLIALIITIVVLLILAGISISMLTGQNGILNRAEEAKDKTEEEQLEEKEKLGDMEDIISEYTGIDWDFVLANAEKHPEQKKSTAIGIGTDGKPVNMDLWEYTLLNDETYGLNTKENLETESSQGVTAGYKGGFTQDGEIEGKIPQYISEDNGNNFKEVTNLKWLFFNCIDMKKSPEIPTTAKILNYTFRACTNLVSTPEIPYGVSNMSRTFLDCTSLENVVNIPYGVIDLSYAFDGCIKLKNVPDIPDSVISMERTFDGCISLDIAPKLSNNLVNMYMTFINCENLKTASIVPSSVTNMNRAFYGCKNLTGEIEINANLTGNIIGDNERDWGFIFLKAATENNCKVTITGECKMLSNIVKEANNPNITLK